MGHESSFVTELGYSDAMVGNNEITAIVPASIQDIRIIIHKVIEQTFPFEVYLIMVNVALLVSLHEVCRVMHYYIGRLKPVIWI